MPIGLEITDTRVVAVVVDENGAVSARADAPVGKDVAGAAQTLLRQLAGASTVPAGIAALMPDSPTVTDAVAALRSEGVATAAAVVPSGTAAAAAESWVGAARGVADVVFLAAGEHITGGIVRGGAPLGGSHGRAGSVAWLALNPVEREDYRKVGCLEAEVAAAGIVRRLVWRIKTGDRSDVTTLAGDDLAAVTVEHVLQAARSGDGVAISIVRDTAKYLGMAAANLVAIADPQTLVIGGIMASAADMFLNLIRTEMQRRLPRSMFGPLTIVPAQLGDDAAAIGAARLAAHALQ